MNPRLKAGAALALTLLLGVPALTACSGSDSDSSSVAAPTAMAPEQGVVGDQAAGGAAADSNGGAAPDKAAGNVIPRSVITTVSTEIEVKSVPEATARVIAATTVAKGYIESQYSSGSGSDSAVTNLTVRIPGGLVEQFLSNISELGTVISTERSAQDVTADVADIDARLANARAGVKRLRELMAKATKVSDIVAIESALSERQAEAESLAAQQRALADQTSMATVTATLSPMTESAPTGFMGGLSSGWHAFTTSVSGLARLVGFLLPFALLGALLVGALLLIVHAATRRHSPAGLPGAGAQQVGAETQPAQPGAPASAQPGPPQP